MVAFSIGTAALAYGGIDAALAELRGESISIVPAQLDFGIGKPREVREQTLLLVNRANRPIRIVGANLGCSCRLKQELPISLAPYESKILMLSLELPNAPSTSLSQRIMLVTDDELSPVVASQFHAATSQP
jgi:hypothetical protein